MNFESLNQKINKLNIGILDLKGNIEKLEKSATESKKNETEIFETEKELIEDSKKNETKKEEKFIEEKNFKSHTIIKTQNDISVLKKELDRSIKGTYGQNYDINNINLTSENINNIIGINKSKKNENYYFLISRNNVGNILIPYIDFDILNEGYLDVLNDYDNFEEYFKNYKSNLNLNKSDDEIRLDYMKNIKDFIDRFYKKILSSNKKIESIKEGTFLK